MGKPIPELSWAQRPPEQVLTFEIRLEATLTPAAVVRSVVRAMAAYGSLAMHSPFLRQTRVPGGNLKHDDGSAIGRWEIKEIQS